MTLKTIIAYLPSIETAPQVLKMAVDLAKRHEAHLIGLHVVPPVPQQRVPRYPVPSEMYTRIEDQLRAEGEAIAQSFTKATRGMSGQAEWQLQWVSDENLIDHVLRETACADVVVTSQEIDYPFDGVPDSASQLVLNGGRPVLMVPQAHEAQTCGEQIVVGWKPGREAERAVFDALPVLQAAKQVYLVTVDEGGSNKTTAQLIAALQRHGVAAEEVVCKSSGAGKALLEQVKALDGDLLVMGCYGRSRLSQLIFGGATRHVLKNMDVPVLMSH
ncbi:MAG: universal stress protein [Alphaproteobacteria bacterium]|nr:universal stress protein [Alphaproteobacteria bacterium]